MDRGDQQTVGESVNSCELDLISVCEVGRWSGVDSPEVGGIL